MVDPNTRMERVLLDGLKNSDSSMVDPNFFRLYSFSFSSHIQIPLWSIPTGAGEVL